MTIQDFSHQHSSAMHKARFLWATFARRVHSAPAIAASALAFSAFAHEMNAYDAYQHLQRQEIVSFQAYEPILSDLVVGSNGWWGALTALHSFCTLELPAWSSTSRHMKSFIVCLLKRPGW